MNPFRTTTLLAVLLLTSCAADSYILHPGAVSRADSIAYDSLLIAQAIIEHSRTEFAAGTLPDTLKPGFNRLIESYNLARATWLTYRAAVKAGGSANEQALLSAMAALNASLQAFQSARAIP